MQQIAAASAQSEPQFAAMVDALAGKTDAAKAMAEGRVQLEAAIRDKPLPAVAIAALAGFVLAALVRR